MNVKKFFKPAFATLLLAVVTGSAFAAGNATVSPYLKTDYAIVSAVLPADEVSRVAIKDTEGNVLYRSAKSLSNISFQKLLDLSNLSDGTYNVFVEGKASKLISSFEVKDHKLVVAATANTTSAPSSESLKAFVRKNDKGLYVSQINPDLAKSMIVIADASGYTVYSSELPSTGTYYGLYRINDLPKGNYTVSLTSGEKTHTYDFTK